MRRPLALLAMIIALFVTPLQPATADTQEDDAEALATCSITRYGYQGTRICGFGYDFITHTDGRVEWFVIGANYAVYHIWPGSGGWKSLGGRARSAEHGYNEVEANGYTIDIIGTDSRRYCRTWPWTVGWYRC